MTQHDKKDKDAKQRAEDHEPERHGDILGVSDADPNVEIPRATDDRSGNPKGIEVGERATGIGHLKPTGGATGVDMGAGGEGTDIEPKK